MDKELTKVVAVVFEKNINLYKNKFQFGKDYLIANAIIKARDQNFKLEKSFSVIKLFFSQNRNYWWTNLPDILFTSKPIPKRDIFLEDDLCNKTVKLTIWNEELETLILLELNLS